MSFILDALKKSETDRQENSDAEFATVPSSPDAPAAPRWLWILGALLAINIVAITALMLRPETSPDQTPTTTTHNESTPALNSSTDSFTDQVADARRTEPAAREPGAIPAPRESTAAVSVDNLLVSRAGILPSLVELRANGTLQLPDMHVDIHVYSDVPSERFVFINMNKYQEKSRLDEGPVVDEITSDGVILEYHGTIFLLPRD